MSVLLAQSPADLCDLIKRMAATQQSAAVTVAKAIVALITVTGSEDEARRQMKRARISDCDVRNAMQLVWCYESIVRPGHATEQWFDGLLYTHAVEIRSAIRKVGVAKLVEWDMFSKSAKSQCLEFDLIGDTGLNKAERVAKAEAEEQARLAREAAPAAPVAPVNGHPAPVLPAEVIIPVTNAEANREAVGTHTNAPASGAAPTVTPTTPETPAAPRARGTRTPLEQFETLITGIERFIEGVFPIVDDVTIEAMKAKITALVAKADAAAQARQNPQARQNQAA